MPLVIVSGFPASGKTRFSEALKALLESKYSDYKISLINDESLGISKRTCYQNAAEEKKARSAFMSAVERSISKDTVVIADNLNYIKGYRYQLYCVARAANTPHCSVHVLSSFDEVKMRNAERADGYPEGVLSELVDRFEEPNNQTKWDSPLFSVVDCAPETLQEICDIICVKKASRPPSFATVSKTSASGEFVATLDRISQELIDQILPQVKPFGPSTITIDKLAPLQLSKPISSGDLASLRRQFIHMNRLHPVDSNRIPELFLNYIKNTQN